MSVNLKGTGPGHNAPVVNGVLDCAESIANGVLDLANGVAIGAADEKCHRSWLGAVLDKGELVLAENGLVD